MAFGGGEVMIHDQPNETAGMVLSHSLALLQRAAADDLNAAAEVVRRLAAGDVELAHQIATASDPGAQRMRAALARYLARGQWHGQPLPLPPGFHAGRAGQHLRDLVTQAACMEHQPAWRASLLDTLNDG